MVYKGVCINKGKTAEQDEAFVNALIDLLSSEELQREFKKWIFDWLKNDKKFQKEFVEWFYSGNWVEEEEE